MGLSASSPKLRRAVEQHDVDAVLDVAVDARASTADRDEAHSWLQRNFDALSTPRRGAYVDAVVKIIRYDQVSLRRQRAWMAWVHGLRQHTFDRRQITDVYFANAAMQRAGCLRQLWALLPSLRGWLED